MAAFDPSQVAGLTLAWSPDRGVALGTGNAIATVAGAFGTSAVLTAGTSAPQIAPGLGPLNQPLFHFARANTQYATFPAFTSAEASFIMAIAPNAGFSGTVLIFIHTSTNSISMSAAGDFRVFPIGGTAPGLEVIPQTVNNNNLQIVTIIYSAAGGGTVNAFVDGIAQPVVTGLGAGGFNSLDNFGGLGTVNTIDAYFGPILVYNRAITNAERQQIEAYLAPWRGLTVYVDQNGSDTSQTFWNPSTPLQHPPTAVAMNWHGGETIAINSTQMFRESARVQSTNSNPDGNPVTIDGGLWPDPSKKAQFRFSVAPTPVLVSGTTYNIGTVTIPKVDVAGDTGYVYIVPGGVVSFGGVARFNTRGSVFPAYDTTNVVRMFQDKVNPTAPVVGKWGLVTDNGDGTGTIVVNAGFALNPGDVEVSIIPSNILVSGFFMSRTDNWIWRRMVVSFALATGFGNILSANITADRIEAWFNQIDGIDATANGLYVDAPGPPPAPSVRQLTTQNYQIIDCISCYNGAGPASGGNPGDGYSQHMNTSGTYFRCSAINNDKSVMDHKGGTTIVCHECWGVGNLGYWLSSDAPEDGGSMTLYNCVCETPPGLSAQAPNGAWTSATKGSLTVYNCTFIADVAAANYIGIHAFAAGCTVTAMNNIIDGFSVGVSTVAGAPFIGDYNLINAIQTYSGVAHGTHDIIAPSNLIKPPTNLHPTFLSRAPGSGIPIPGVTIDYAGNPRSNSAPTIGAFEAPLMIVGGSSGPAYGQTYDRKVDEEDEEAMLVLLH